MKKTTIFLTGFVSALAIGFLVENQMASQEMKKISILILWATSSLLISIRKIECKLLKENIEYYHSEVGASVALVMYYFTI